MQRIIGQEIKELIRDKSEWRGADFRQCEPAQNDQPERPIKWRGANGEIQYSLPDARQGGHPRVPPNMLDILRSWAPQKFQ